jgi:hypothetical protein
MTDLVPGNYLVAAVDRSTLGNVQNPAAALDLIAPVAERVTLGESTQQTLDLTTRSLPTR